MAEKHSFNINAELYQNEFGELAMKLPGEKVYCEVGENEGADFVSDAKEAVLHDKRPERWREMPAHELLYGRDWRCVSRFGFVDGDEEKPAVEFEIERDELSEKARSYLGRVLH